MRHILVSEDGLHSDYLGLGPSGAKRCELLCLNFRTAGLRHALIE
jgi:hypothetical protein